MYPDCKSSGHGIKRRQQGFLIPVALFIVVGLGVLAVSIARMTSGTHSSVVREAVSVQALFAAESGAQYSLNQLFFDATSRSEVDSRCAAVDGESLSFTVQGLAGCSVTIECATVSNTGDSAHIYQVRSTSSCGSNDLSSQRVVSIKARYN